MKPPSRIKNLRLVLERPAHIDAGVYHKGQYALTFERNKKFCKTPIQNNGDKRPLGQDAIDAMQTYILRGEITEYAVLNCKVVNGTVEE